MAKIIPLGQNNMLTSNDYFCGLGGVTEGMKGTGFIQVLAALNHDEHAIHAHQTNNPEVVHIQEDFSDFEKTLHKLPIRANIGWASVECTNHSNAKGGLSRDADSRSLAQFIPAYMERCMFDYFFVENVREFMDWGPVWQKKDKAGNLVFDKKGNAVKVPVPGLKGLYFRSWISWIEMLGYSYQFAVLNCADFGLPTSRIRYFGVFTYADLKYDFPKQTHSKTGGNGLEKWVACRDYIDLNFKGESIFDRKNNLNIRKGNRIPLVYKTLARIAYGLKKYCLKDFILKYYGSNGKPNNVSSLDGPCGTITTKDRHYLTSVEYNQFITQNIWGAQTATSTDLPLGTILTRDEKQVVTTELNSFILKKESNKYGSQSLDSPLGTITTNDAKQLISAISTGDICPKKEAEKRAFFKEFLPEWNRDLLCAVVRDIKFRYLTSYELAAISTFNNGTYLGRTETIRKKHVGNAVPPDMVKMLLQPIAKLNGIRINQKAKKVA